jgi:hypothetical protein
MSATKTYSGRSTSTTAPVDEALKSALAAARKGENVNHFTWKLDGIEGDVGGVVGQTVTVHITVTH